ncbi:beta-N-acetylhexosaminidase [Paenibacillus albidus]|nr:beta-N-acetylhexosaminidase [Paenibacillus albidus]
MVEAFDTNERIRRKVGQMFMCGFMDTAPNRDILKLIREYHIGGIIYFRRNIGTAEEVYKCSAALQQAAGEPLLIAIDQEGGMVARIEEGVTLMPGNMALGATRNTAGVRQAAYICGTELRHLGINMNFAPCVDVNNNPANPVIGVRSYGESPTLVSEMGTAAVEGYQEAGVAATIKHFPGHGDTDTDSHLALPIIGHNRQRLEEVELLPFRQIIESGVDAVMTAHVIFPAYEEEAIPATLSSNILGGLLRKELSFGGVIVTDCLEMNAISQTVGVGPGAVQAVKAGADLILVSHTYNWQVEAMEAVIEAVLQGEIPEERIDESVQRLVQLKERRGITRAAPKPFAALQGKLASRTSMDVAEALSEQSITLLCDDGQLPLTADEPVYVVWPEVRTNHEVIEALHEEVTLGKALELYIREVNEQVIDVDPSEAEIMQVLEESKSFSQVVAVTYNADFSPGQRRILQGLTARSGIRLIVVAARNPYDYTAVSGIRTCLACYENKPLAMRAASKVLAGLNAAPGILPVTLGEFTSGIG